MNRDLLILSYHPLVHRLAKQYAPLLASLKTSTLTLDDLVQEGNIGLITAIDRGKAPMPFIIKFILEAIRSYANILTRPCHCQDELLSLPLQLPVAAEDDDSLTLSDVLSDDDTPLLCLIREEERMALQRAFESLKPMQRSVLTDYFGLSSKPLSTVEIAAKYHLSCDRIKKIRQIAIKTLYHATRF